MYLLWMAQQSEQSSPETQGTEEKSFCVLHTTLRAVGWTGSYSNLKIRKNLLLVLDCLFVYLLVLLLYFFLEYFFFCLPRRMIIGFFAQPLLFYFVFSSCCLLNTNFKHRGSKFILSLGKIFRCSFLQSS